MGNEIELSKLEIEAFFIKATSKGRRNAQTFRKKGAPYYSQYHGCEVVPVSVMKKGTHDSFISSLLVIKINSWGNPLY